MIRIKDESDRDIFIIKRSTVYLVVALVIVSVGGFLAYTLLSPTSNNKNLTGAVSLVESASVEEPVSAEEIYKLFICTCCGRTIDTRCCGMARDMVNYVDSQIDAGLSKTDVIIQTVKKYGLNTLIKLKQEEIKAEILKRSPADRPKIVISPEFHDFADVSQVKGTVSTFFTIKNDGKSDLIIDGLSTSCGCTTASIGGSPFFGMAGHGGVGASPPGWTYKIPPGETGELEVKYDPNMHKDFRGAATRIIYIASNDPVDFRYEVRIELNQID